MGDRFLMQCNKSMFLLHMLPIRQDTAKLNTGVMFFRSTNWTIGLLDWVYRFSPASSHWGDPFHDQVLF